MGQGLRPHQRRVVFGPLSSAGRDVFMGVALSRRMQADWVSGEPEKGSEVRLSV